MNRTKIMAMVTLLAASVAVGAYGAAAKGNCESKADALTSDGNTQVTFVRLWDDWNNDWVDAADTVKDQAGGYWYKLTLNVGGNYVFYVDTQTVNPSDESFYVGIGEIIGAEGVISGFDYYLAEDGIEYYYITPSMWYDEGPTAEFYVKIEGSYPGVKCKFSHYSKSIAEFLSPGLELSPIPFNASTNGSFAVSSPFDGATECYYTTTLAASNIYSFVIMPSNPLNVCSISTFDEVNWNYNYDYNQQVDSATGAYTMRVMPYEDLEVVMSVYATDLEDCTFTWGQSIVGGVGLANTKYTLADDAGAAIVTVTRTSNDAAHRVRWMTVAGTADAGIDYVPMSGELMFEKDGELSQEIVIPLVPGAPVDGGPRNFAVRLDRVPDEELLDGEYSPSPSPYLAYVTIIPTGEGEPMPDVPAAVEEDSETPLAVGTFEGVLRGGGLAATMTLAADASGALSASLAINGTTHILAGGDGELSGTVSLNGKNYQFYFQTTLPGGTVEDLDEAPGGCATATGSVYAIIDGKVEEVFLSGSLYRVESRLDGATLGRMEEKAGRYTLALSDELGVGAAGEYGYLTVDVAGDGSATATGALADGTAVSFTSIANDVADGLAMPFAWSGGAKSLGGTLILKDKYDYWTELARLYNGWALAVNDKSSPLDGTLLYAESGMFVGAEVADVSLNRTTGLLSGVIKGKWRFAVVLINSAMKQDAIGAVGSAIDDGGNVVPLIFRLNWTDPDWSETSDIYVTVSFEGNGGVGTIPTAITEQIGGTIILPENPFVMDGYKFMGWRDTATSVTYAEGATIKVPADDTVLEACWVDDRIKQALDGNIDFSAENWPVVNDADALNGKCLKAVVQAEYVRGSVTAIVNGAGKFTFNWKLVRRRECEYNNPIADRIILKVDGVVKWTSPDADSAEFMSAECEIKSAGTHEVVWEYECPEAPYQYIEPRDNANAAIELDNVKWEATSSEYAAVTFNVARDDATVDPESVQVKIGTPVGALPTPVCETRDFVRWVDASGNEVTEATKVPKRGLVLTAEWEAKTWTVSYDAGGAEGEVPQSDSAKEGEMITLPDAKTLSMENGEFAGWTDGAGVYPANSSYQMVASNVTLTATWADATLKKTLDTDIAVTSPDVEKWEIVKSGEAACGESYLKAKTGGMSFSAEVSMHVNGRGTLEFSWRLERRNDYEMLLDDRITLSIDGVETNALRGVEQSEWKVERLEVTEAGGHDFTWRAEGPTPTYEGYIDDTVRNIVALDNVRWTPATPEDFSEAVVTETTTPADLGITEGAFATEDAGSPNLVKLVAWARANDVSVAQVNGIEFSEGASGSPVGDLADNLAAAYLLNCAPDEVEEKAAEFTVTSFSVDAAGNITIEPSEGSEYGNGQVEVRYSATIGGEYTTDKPAGSQCFVKLYLVK